MVENRTGKPNIRGCPSLRVERSVKRIERREKKKEKALLSSRTKLELLLDTIHFDVSMMLLLLLLLFFNRVLWLVRRENYREHTVFSRFS